MTQPTDFLEQLAALAEKRFWSKVDKRGPDECWHWNGANSRGYGQFWLDGKKRKATHVAVELATGAPFPVGMMACHTCDNPPCVNPSHLFVGTMKDNITDAYRKGRVTLEAMMARNANREKTECHNGHPLHGHNLYKHPNGSRVCRACMKAIRKQYKMRARAALKGGSNEQG